MTAWWRNFLYSIYRLNLGDISISYLVHYRTRSFFWIRLIFVKSGFSFFWEPDPIAERIQIKPFLVRSGPDFQFWGILFYSMDQNPWHRPDQVKFRTKFLTSDLTRLKSGPKSVSQTGQTYLGPKIGTTEFRTSLVFRSGHVQDRFHSRPFTLGQKIHFNLFGPNTISGSVGHVTAIINHNGR